MVADVVVLVLVASDYPMIVGEMPGSNEAGVQVRRQRLDRRDEFHGVGGVADSPLPAWVPVPTKASRIVALDPDLVALDHTSAVPERRLLALDPVGSIALRPERDRV